MLPVERPAIIFLAVRLWNFVLRSVMEPKSLRVGWSGTESAFRVETEELGERSDNWSCWSTVLLLFKCGLNDAK